MPSKSTNYFNYNNRIPLFIDESDACSYLEELRTEVFAQENIRSLVKTVLVDVPRDILYAKNSFPLVAEQYNWPSIRQTLEHIISSCNGVPKSPIYKLLVQAWSLIPGYLKLHSAFYERTITENKYSALIFMHEILVNNILPVDASSILLSSELPDDLFLSLDTGIVTRIQTKTSSYSHMMSQSPVKLRAAVKAIHSNLWDNIDIDGIIAAIMDNTGNRYYNISTDKWVNISTVKRMVNVNHNFKTVASKDDKDLFDYIISLLENNHLSFPIINQVSPTVHSRLPTHPIPRNTFIISSDDDELFYLERDDNSDSDSFEAPIPPKKTKSFPQTRAPLVRSDTDPIKETKKTKRKNIPSKVRQMTWRKYIGNSMDGKCWSCDEHISFEKWHAGHVNPHSKGGPDIVDNLRPVCAACNLSMSSKHMADYIRDYGMKGRGAVEFNIIPSKKFKSAPFKVELEIPETDMCDILGKMAHLSV